MYVCAPHVCPVLLEAKECVGPPGTGGTESCELHAMWAWEQNPGWEGVLLMSTQCPQALSCLCRSVHPGHLKSNRGAQV